MLCKRFSSVLRTSHVAISGLGGTQEPACSGPCGHARLSKRHDFKSLTVQIHGLVSFWTGKNQLLDVSSFPDRCWQPQLANGIGSANHYLVVCFKRSEGATPSVS